MQRRTQMASIEEGKDGGFGGAIMPKKQNFIPRREGCLCPWLEISGRRG
jgi:hypothetical protein